MGEFGKQMVVRSHYKNFQSTPIWLLLSVISGKGIILSGSITFFNLPFVETVIERFQLRLVVYDPNDEVILEWKR